MTPLMFLKQVSSVHQVVFQHLFDPKYSKNSKLLKYFYDLK